MKVCRHCSYSVAYGRCESYSMFSHGRKMYHCENPHLEDLYDIKPEIFPKVKMRGFLAFGDTSLDSPIQMKTAPRWCPLKHKEALQFE